MRPFPIIALSFLLIPIIEIYVLIQVGSKDMLGPAWTIFLVVFTAVLGAFLLRQQGLSTLARFQNHLAQGQLPAQEMVEGILLAIGGALLLTPGFVTDTIGFLCLLPVTRQLLAKAIIKRSTLRMATQFRSPSGEGFHQSTSVNPSAKGNEGNIVEGEFTEVDEKTVFFQRKK